MCFRDRGHWGAPRASCHADPSDQIGLPSEVSNHIAPAPAEEAGGRAPVEPCGERRPLLLRMMLLPTSDESTMLAELASRIVLPVLDSEIWTGVVTDECLPPKTTQPVAPDKQTPKSRP